MQKYTKHLKKPKNDGPQLRKRKTILTFAVTEKRPDGGIGRRDGLKHRWSNPSRFDPGSGY